MLVLDQTLKEFIESVSESQTTLTPNAIGGMIPARFEYGNEKEYVSSYEITPWMSNPGGLLHGGVICAIYDQWMCMLAMFNAGGKTTPTQELKVSYCHAVPLGARMFMRARVMSQTRTTIMTYGEAWIEGQEDRIVSYASGTYHIIDKENSHTFSQM